MIRLPMVLAMGGTIGLGGCASRPTGDPVAGVSETLKAFHAAAAEADEDAYFDLMTEDAVFLGTDATERWTKEEFRIWARPFFQRDSAWVYESIERHIGLNADCDTAWFDEVVRNESYGDLRGTGALVLTPEGWRITQYNLTFLVPNEIAPQVVEMIRAALSD